MDYYQIWFAMSWNVEINDVAKYFCEESNKITDESIINVEGNVNKTNKIMDSIIGTTVRVYLFAFFYDFCTITEYCYCQLNFGFVIQNSKDQYSQ